MSKPQRSDAARGALEQRRAHAVRDLEELAQQVEDGEIAEADAAVLEARYRKDLEAVESKLGSMPKTRTSKPSAPGVKPAAAESGTPPGNTRRILLIMAATLAVLTVGIVVIANLGGDDAATQAVPAADTPVQGGEGSTLEQMESVLADHPESNGMRLALAGLYFDQADYLPAMEHYSYVLEHDPLPEEEVIALARIGWMAHITGQPLTAVGYLEQAVELDPLYGEAKLFLGVVLLYGAEDAEGALPILEEVLAYPDLPESLRPDVQVMVDEARTIVEGG